MRTIVFAVAASGAMLTSAPLLAGAASPASVQLAQVDVDVRVGPPAVRIEEERRPGVVIEEEMPAGYAAAPAERRRIGATLMQTLAALHAVDWCAVGLADFGRPDGYLARQVRRWSEQWERSKTSEVPLIRELIRRVGITTVLVTHEQDEAFDLGDRVAVLRGGRLEQVGTPDELYAAPANRFVGGFVGRSSVVPVTVIDLSAFSPSEVPVAAASAAPSVTSIPAVVASSSTVLAGAVTTVGSNIHVAPLPETVMSPLSPSVTPPPPPPGGPTSETPVGHVVALGP